MKKVKAPKTDHSGNTPGTNWYVGARGDFTIKELYAISRWTRQCAQWLRQKKKRKS